LSPPYTFPSEKIIQTPQSMLSNAMAALAGELETVRQLSSNIDDLKKQNDNSSEAFRKNSNLILKDAETTSKRLERAIKSLVALSKESREAKKDSSAALTGLSEKELARKLLDGPMKNIIMQALRQDGYTIIEPSFHPTPQLNTPRGEFSKIAPISDGKNDSDGRRTISPPQKETINDVGVTHTSHTSTQAAQFAESFDVQGAQITPAVRNPFRINSAPRFETSDVIGSKEEK
jgi:hypothetical protein